MEDLGVILDGEAADNGENFGEMFLVCIEVTRKIIDHLDELGVGEWRVVDDGAVGCRNHVSGSTIRLERTTSLTGVRTSDAVFGGVDEAERIEGHVLDSLDSDIFRLCVVSEEKLTRVQQVRMIEPERLVKRARGDQGRCR